MVRGFRKEERRIAGRIEHDRAVLIMHDLVRDRLAANDLVDGLFAADLDGPCVSIDFRAAKAGEDLLEIEGAEIRPDDEQPDDEACIADAIGDERLVGGIRRTLAFKVEADEQIRANTYKLPTHENLEK